MSENTETKTEAKTETEAKGVKNVATAKKPAAEKKGVQTGDKPKTDMSEKLQAAGKKAEEQATARREKTVKGSHLLDQLLAQAEKKGLKTELKSGFAKITGSAKGRTVYVARKGGRADVSGFELKHEAVKQVSEAEAREKHLGKVRGHLDFEKPDDVVMEAFGIALEKLNEEIAAPAPAPTEKK